jgi:hypothetical protein
MTRVRFVLGEEWKDLVRYVPEVILSHLAKVVCLQTECTDRGFDPSHCGQCAACADTAESVVGEYLRLTQP